MAGPETSPPKDFESKVEALKRALFMREVHQLAELYKDILTAKPDYLFRGPVQYDLGCVLERGGHDFLALEAYRLLIEKQSDNKARNPALRAAGHLAFKLKKHELCAQYLQEFLKSDPLTEEKERAREVLAQLPPGTRRSGEKQQSDSSIELSGIKPPPLPQSKPPQKESSSIKLDREPSEPPRENSTPMLFEWKVPTESLDEEPKAPKKRQKATPPPASHRESDASISQVPTEDLVESNAPGLGSFSSTDLHLAPPELNTPPPLDLTPEDSQDDPNTFNFGMPPSPEIARATPPAKPLPKPEAPPAALPQKQPPPIQQQKMPRVKPPAQPFPEPDSADDLAPPAPPPPMQPAARRGSNGHARKREPEVAPPPIAPPSVRPGPAPSSSRSRQKSIAQSSKYSTPIPLSDESPEERFERLKHCQFALLLPRGKKIRFEAVSALLAELEGVSETVGKKLVLERKGLLYEDLPFDRVMELLPRVDACRQSLVFANIAADLRLAPPIEILSAELHEKGIIMRSIKEEYRLRWRNIRMVSAGEVNGDVSVSLLGGRPMKEYRFIDQVFDLEEFLPSSQASMRRGIREFLSILRARTTRAEFSHTAESVLSGKAPLPQSFTHLDEYRCYMKWLLYSYYGEIVDARELDELNRVSSHW